MDHEDLFVMILDGLGSEYQFVIDAVKGSDTPNLFWRIAQDIEEITLQQLHSPSLLVLAMANPTAEP